MIYLVQSEDSFRVLFSRLPVSTVLGSKVENHAIIWDMEYLLCLSCHGLTHCLEHPMANFHSLAIH